MQWINQQAIQVSLAAIHLIDMMQVEYSYVLVEVLALVCLGPNIAETTFNGISYLTVMMFSREILAVGKELEDVLIKCDHRVPRYVAVVRLKAWLN